MKKLISIEEAISHIEDGMTVMIGGFLNVGTPEKLIDALVLKGVKDLTIIANDTGFENVGIGKLVCNKMAKKVIASHIGTNKETGRQMTSSETIVELVPQGTLAERIRAAGAGLGGIITPTGLGTIVEEGKEKIVIDNKEFLVEKALKADVALVFATECDEKGNCFFGKATKNFNPLIATAADKVIVQAVKVVKVGELDPDRVHTPGLFVDYIVKEEA